MIDPMLRERLLKLPTSQERLSTWEFSRVFHLHRNLRALVQYYEYYNPDSPKDFVVLNSHASVRQTPHGEALYQMMQESPGFARQITELTQWLKQYISNARFMYDALSLEFA